MGRQQCNLLSDTSDGSDLEKLQTNKDRPLGVAYMVSRLDRALGSQIRKTLSPLGLTPGQYTALSVFCSSGPLSNAQLAEHTMVSPQAANELIKVMEEKGWIERKQGRGRIIDITLTDEGIDMLDSCNKKISLLEREMLNQLNDQQISDMHQYLRNSVNELRTRGG